MAFPQSAFSRIITASAFTFALATQLDLSTTETASQPATRPISHLTQMLTIGTERLIQTTQTTDHPIYPQNSARGVTDLTITPTTTALTPSTQTSSTQTQSAQPKIFEVIANLNPMM